MLKGAKNYITANLMQNFYPFFSLLIGYLIGSIASAVVIARVFSLPDPRKEGSNNPGATNVLRLGGKKAAVLTLLGDLCKGLLPVLLAKSLFEQEIIWFLVGLGAFFGHLYPLYFGFKGGKGVATALGVFFAWNIWLGMLCLLIWLLVFAIKKISSLSSLIAAFFAPIIALLLNEGVRFPMLVLLISGLLVYRHKANIQRLINGEEKAFSFSKK